MTRARTAAYRVLRAVAAGDDLPDALARLRDILADERDRALVTEISTGTLRWLGALDRVIEQAAARPIARLDGEVLTVLRLGAYQLLHLDRVPAAAAVHESVTLVRRVGKSSAAGLVNAVLRSIASADTPPLPREPGPLDSQEAHLAYLSITCSHPRWLVERWLDRRGFPRTVEWVRFNNVPPALTLRANLLRTTTAALAQQLAEHDVRTEPTRFARGGLRVLSGNPLRTPLSGQGLFLVQDEASQLVAELTAGSARRTRAGRLRRTRGEGDRDRRCHAGDGESGRERPSAGADPAAPAHARPGGRSGGPGCPGWIYVSRRRSSRSSTVCWSMSPAPASASCDATLRYGGGANQTTWYGSPGTSA